MRQTRLALPAVLIGCALLSCGPFGSGPARAAAPQLVAKLGEAGQAIVRGDYKRSVALYTEVLAKPGLEAERRATVLNDRALAYWRLGLAEAALKDLNQAVKLYPEFAALYNNRGNILLALGLAKEAIKDFDRAILLAPRYAEAYNNRANAFSKLGRHQAALKDYNKALRLAPANAVPFHGRGRVQLALARPYAALRDFSRGIKLDPSFAQGYRNRAQVYRDLGRYNAAIDDLDRAVNLAPNDPELHLAKAQALIDKTKLTPALKEIKRALELAPEHSGALALRGLALAHLGSYDEALEDFARAIELDHRNATAYAARAWTYNAMQSYALALPDVERALKLEPKNLRALRVRAEAREALGQLEEAVADYREIIRLAPGDRKAAAALERLTGEGRPDEQLVNASDLSEWFVVIDGTGRYFALSERHKNLRIPLEVYGGKVPRLIDWELKKRPYRGIGVLRFNAGVIAGENGPEEAVYGAIVDLYNANRVVALEPISIGTRLASWSWESGRLTVKGPDGITSTYKLRTIVRARRRVVERNPFGSDRYWSGFWDSGRGYDSYVRPAPRAGRQRARRRGYNRRRRSRTLFDLLFR